MVTRRPSSAQYKKTSRQMRRATLGTHVARVPSPFPSARKDFSNPRRTRKAERGEIRQVLPNTSTRETRRDYANRMSQQAFIERAIASGRRRKIALFTVLAIAALAIAGIAAGFVFVSGINARMQISDAALTSALADAPEEGAIYTLLSASFDDGDSGSGPDVALLVRTDPDQASASIAVIPGNVRTKLSDGETHRLGDAQSVGGDAEVVTAVEELSGVQVSHYVKTDASSFVSLVNALGDIQVDVPETANDPDAGSSAIASGPQLLNGEQALYFCRANDFASLAEQQRGANDALVAQALFERFVGMGKMTFYMNMDECAGLVQSDLDPKGAFALLSSLRDIAPGSIMVGAMPTYTSEINGVSYQVPIADEWSAMMERMQQGQALQQDKQDLLSSVDPASFSITVNNGGGVEGAALDASELLKNAGFNVTEVGNAAQAVYDSTLVVYQKEDDEAKAEALVATLGTGRAVYDAINYSFETDILVVVGKDWQSILDAKGSTASTGDSSNSTDQSYDTDTSQTNLSSDAS